VVAQHGQGLVDLGHEGIRTLDQVQQLSVVHLQKHTGDLAGLLGLVLIDQRIQSLADHVLLGDWVGRGEHSITEVHVAVGHLLGLLLRSTLLQGLALVAHLVGELDAALHVASGSLALRDLLLQLLRIALLRTGASLQLLRGLALRRDTLLRSAETWLTRDAAWDSLGRLLQVLRSAWDASRSTSAAWTLHERRDGLLSWEVTIAGWASATLLLERQTSGGTSTTDLAGVWEWHTSWLRSSRETWLTTLLHVHAHEGRNLTVLRSTLELTSVLRSIGGGKVSLAMLLALVKGHHQRLTSEWLAVHLSDSAGGLLGGGVADESEALGGLQVSVAHDAGRGDGSERGECLSELLVSHGVSNVLDVQVHALVLLNTLVIDGVQAGLDLSGALVLLLCAGHIDLEVASGVLDGLVGQLGKGLGGTLMVRHVDEAEAFGDTIHHSDGDICNASKGSKQLLEFGLVPGDGKHLDIQVGPVILSGTLLSLDEGTHGHLDLIDQGAIELGDSIGGGLSSLEVDITIAFGRTTLVSCDFARQNVSEDREGIVQTLVVHRRSKVSDEDISNTRLAKRWVSLGPHDSARSGFDVSEVHGVKSSLSILDIVKIHVSVSQRTSSDGVSADTDRCDRTDTVEELEEETLLRIKKQNLIPRLHQFPKNSFTSVTSLCKSPTYREADWNGVVVVC
jgi:hypothetical protein